jgi:hypothetical protein
MRMRHVGVMARLLVIARFVVLGGFTMVGQSSDGIALEKTPSPRSP